MLLSPGNPMLGVQYSTEISMIDADLMPDRYSLAWRCFGDGNRTDHQFVSPTPMLMQ